MVGAGNRGYLAYGAYAERHPDKARFVAVVEPDEGRRARFGEAHRIPADRRFSSWEELAARPQVAPALVNATMDRPHRPSTLALLAAGYEILLEKPIATTPQECLQIIEAAETGGRLLQIAHVLRYAPFFLAIRDLVAAKRLGEIVSVDWREKLTHRAFLSTFLRVDSANTRPSRPLAVPQRSPAHE